MSIKYLRRILRASKPTNRSRRRSRQYFSLARPGPPDGERRRESEMIPADSTISPAAGAGLAVGYGLWGRSACKSCTIWAASTPRQGGMIVEGNDGFSPSSSNGRQKQGTLHNSEQAVWSKQGARMPSRFIVIGGTAMNRRLQANRRVATKTRLFLHFIANSAEATMHKMDEMMRCGQTTCSKYQIK